MAGISVDQNEWTAVVEVVPRTNVELCLAEGVQADHIINLV